jgi:hypothetical protein
MNSPDSQGQPTAYPTQYAPGVNITETELETELDSSFSTIGLKASASIAIVVARGINHAPTLRLPNATYRGEPCTSQAGQLAHNNEISPVSVELQCDRIIYVEEYHVQEDISTLIKNVSVHDIDIHDDDIVISNFRLNISTVHGVVSIKNYQTISLTHCGPPLPLLPISLT